MSTRSARYSVLLPTLLIAGMAVAGAAAAQDDSYMGAFNNAGQNIADIAGNAAVSKSIRDDAARKRGQAAASPRTLSPQQQGVVQNYMQSLRREYERRVRADGRASADAWLRGVAADLGRQAGEAERARRLREGRR